MNRRFTLIIFAVFVVLAVFAYTQRSATPVDIGKGTLTPTPGPLLGLSGKDVQELGVVSATGSYTLTRVEDGWHVNGQPSNDQVEAVVTTFVSPTILGELPASANPDDYGFATPSLTVTLQTASGESHVIHAGDKTPVDSNVYIRVDSGTRIVITPATEYDLLMSWTSAPPYAPTATPAMAPPGTPTPPDDAAATPGSEGTPAEATAASPPTGAQDTPTP